MLRSDAPYKGKRSKDLLKYKAFSDDEYEVVDVEMGPFRYVKDGAECEETMLSCVTIKHKGYDVRVGSGFSIEQRQEFYKNPKKILGKIILVQYFEETENEKGGISLRFPTFKYLYGDSRDT
jgi:DNA ligase-1